LLQLAGCGPILIALGIGEATADETVQQDLGEPAVDISVVPEAGESDDVPEYANSPLRFRFRASKPGVALSTITIGPIPPGADLGEIGAIAADYCDKGSLPAAPPVPIHEHRGLSTDPDQNTDFNAFIDGLSDGSYQIHLRGIDEQARADCSDEEWVLDTLPPSKPRLARVEAGEARSVTATWTRAEDPPRDAGQEASGLAGYRVHFAVGGTAIPEPPRPPDAPFDGMSLVPASQGGAGTSPFVVDGAALEATLLGLYAARRHYLRVTAVDRAGNETDLAAADEGIVRTRTGGDGTFLPATSHAAGASAGALRAGDWDRDGLVDLLAIDQVAGGLIVLFGKGDGTFEPAASHALPVGRELKAADWNWDGITDFFGNNGAILSGTGSRDTPFEPTGNVGDSGDAVGVGLPWVVFSAVQADVEVPDTFDARLLPFFQTVLLFGPTTHFTSEKPGFSNPPLLGTQTLFMELVDVDGDDQPDVVSGDTTAIGISIQGGRSFGNATLYPAGGSPNDMAIGNFRKNRAADLAVATREGDVAILLGLGNGTFEPFSRIEIGTRPGVLAKADFNSDAIEDLAVVGAIPGIVSVLTGNGAQGIGDGTFTGGATTPFDGTPTAAVASDFNRDGIPDLAISTMEGTIEVLLGRGALGEPDLAFAQPVVIELPATSVDSADLNGDGVADLVVSRGPSGVDILLARTTDGQGDGRFQSRLNFRPGSIDDVSLHDIDGDDILDLVCQGDIPQSGKERGLPRLRGNGSDGIGDGTFSDTSVVVNPSGAIETGAACDPLFLGAERAGVLLQGQVLQLVTHIDDVTRTVIGPGVSVHTDCGPDGIAVGDVNNDREDDMVLFHGTHGSVSLGRGFGFTMTQDPFGAPYVAGTPDGVQTFDAGVRPARPVVADFNIDNDVDFAVVNRGTNDVSVLLGQVLNPPAEERQGIIASRTVHTFAAEPTWLAVADLNRDGMPDLAVLHGVDRSISLLLSDRATKTHSIRAGPGVPGSGELTGITVADFNSDGILDLAVGGDAVRIFFGTGSIRGQ
jgi:hypothetical protein